MMKKTVLLLIVLTTVLACLKSKESNKGLHIENNNKVTEQLTDSVLQLTLEGISVKDQTLRLLLPDVNKRFGKDSKEEKFFWKLIHKQDSICGREVINIIENYGWLGQSRVGEKANQTLWLVIQHAPVHIQEKYLPLLKTSADSGESPSWHYAYLKDRILMYQKKPQVYGTQSVWDKEIGKTKIYEIEDIENVNKRRKSVGLEPIKF